jgi:hypothetical protein
MDSNHLTSLKAGQAQPSPPLVAISYGRFGFGIGGLALGCELASQVPRHHGTGLSYHRLTSTEAGKVFLEILHGIGSGEHIAWD